MRRRRHLPLETIAWLRANYYTATDAELGEQFPGVGSRTIDYHASSLGLWPKRRQSLAEARRLGLTLETIPEGTELWQHRSWRLCRVVVRWGGPGTQLYVEPLRANGPVWVHRAALSVSRDGPRLLL